MTSGTGSSAVGTGALALLITILLPLGGPVLLVALTTLVGPNPGEPATRKPATSASCRRIPRS